jgi:hypothetical protein
MRYLFVSPEKVAQDQYRHGAIFRFAGALLLLGIALQLPGLFCILPFLERFQAQACFSFWIADAKPEILQDVVKLAEWEQEEKLREQIAARNGGRY